MYVLTRVVCLAALVGCGEVTAKPSDAAAGSDSQQQDGAGPACDVTKPFGPAIEVPVLHDPTGNDTHATLSADEKTIYFASDRMGGGPPPNFHIFTASRQKATDPFDAPALLGATFSNEGESHPSVSPDGNTIYFDSFRPTTGSGVVHVFTSTRTSAAVVFPPATKINADFVTHPAITSDGAVLYAANLSTGRFSRMDRVGTGFGPQQDVAIAATESIVSPVTNDDLTMFLSFGDTTGHSIGITKRMSKTAAFSMAMVVPELALGTAVVAEPSWLSADGCRMYLTYGSSGAAKTTIFLATRPK